MTELLEKAIAEVSKLPDTRQDRVASWLLEELSLEQQEEEPEETLAELLTRARAEIARGDVYPLESILLPPASPPTFASVSKDCLMMFRGRRKRLTAFGKQTPITPACFSSKSASMSLCILLGWGQH